MRDYQDETNTSTLPKRKLDVFDDLKLFHP